MNNYQFNILARKYMDMIFRLAFGMLKSKSDADDITQNVLLSLYKTDKVFENDTHIKNWLIRVTVNECKKVWRSPWSRTEDFADYSDTLVFEDSRQNEVYQAIMSLDRKSRAVIVLYYYEGYSTKEIAEILKVPVNTVYTRLSRARERLKKLMTEEDDNLA